MQEFSKETIEAIVRQVLGKLLIENDDCPVKKVAVPSLTVTEEHRMDTGNPADRVWTRDLFTLEQSPRLGCGLMVMEHTTFPWTLNYDEIDYVVEGQLSILINGKRVTAGPGEIILIPKGSSIQFSVEDKARFLYFVYPANWQEQA
ncbi:MAG: DUF861 domain-containing protein [Clostridia bacterium]|nr:DUF861 domain-containing protein [Clostridia bacterium]